MTSTLRTLTHAITEEAFFVNDQITPKPTAWPPIVVFVQFGRPLPYIF